MIVRQLTTEDIIPVKPTDKGTDILGWMDEYKVAHLPIVDDMKFCGLASEVDIFNMDDPGKPVKDCQLSEKSGYIYDYQHIYDVFLLFSDLKLSLIPVIDSAKNFLGIITPSIVLSQLSEISSVKNPGGLIILELNPTDYALSEIAQIVESNDARILSMFITSPPDSTKMELTLKINRMEIEPIIKTFDRYNYEVKATFAESDAQDDLRERYESFMKYLNI